MSLFDSLEYLADPRPDKILAATGAWKNERGETPRFECVRVAEDRIRQQDPCRDYLEPAGYLPLCESMQRLLFADEHQMTPDGASVPAAWPVRTIHTPGGTAALRLGADLINTAAGRKAIWVSDPTWGNHLKVFRAAGLTVQTYPYPVENGLLHADRLLESVEAIPEGDVLMLQASTHNPACVDLSLEDWQQLAGIVARRELFPFFDAAFFGFTDGVDEDLAGLRTILAATREAIVVTSLSKSFALYNRRVGTLSIIGRTETATVNAFEQARHLIRASYSNPPFEGAAVVAEVLCDRHLYAMWEQELERVRARMGGCREDLVRRLREYGVERDLTSLTRERGLFTRFDLTPEQIRTLQAEQAIYLSPTGWLNVTAIADHQTDRFCRCVSACLR